MTVPAFNFSQPIVDAGGAPSKPFRDWVNAVTTQSNANTATAAAATPATRNIIAAGGLHVGGNLTNDVGIALYRVIASVANLPTVGNAQGDWAFALNGRKPGEGAGAGTGVPAYWSNGAWIAVGTSAAVAA